MNMSILFFVQIAENRKSYRFTHPRRFLVRLYRYFAEKPEICHTCQIPARLRVLSAENTGKNRRLRVMRFQGVSKKGKKFLQTVEIHTKLVYIYLKTGRRGTPSYSVSFLYSDGRII